MITPEEILAYWLDEVGPKGWYDGGEELDAEVRQKFEAGWNAAMDGRYGLWLTYPSGALAYIILMDQFPRNMFRGSPKAFSSDPMALAAAKQAVYRGWDMKIDEPARQFFYMPLMHSENLCDQDRCVRLMLERMPNSGDSNLLHAKVHRAIIRLFGRFPYRNEVLARNSSEPEAKFVAEGGYRQILQELESA